MDCGPKLKNRQRRGLKSSLHLYVNVSNWTFVGLRVPGSVSKCAESATGRCSRQWRQVAIGQKSKHASMVCRCDNVQRRSMKYARRELLFQEDLLSSLEKKLQLETCRPSLLCDVGGEFHPIKALVINHLVLVQHLILRSLHSIKCSAKATL